MSSLNEKVEILIDHRFNIPSYEQYLKDNQTKKFTKICMTQVINADVMIATYGEEAYFATSSAILNMGNEAYKQMGIDHLIHVYVHSYKSFMAVANDDMSDDDFYNLMKVNHEQYELISSRETKLGGISRFVLAFGDNLINKTQSAFYLNRDLQNNFIVAGNECEQLKKNDAQLIEVLHLLEYAMQNNKVVPFYQGIHSNNANKINKYEALMRIYDKDGKVYPPGMFLEAAKTLKLYLPLSKIIINKALKDFENKESTLGINISLLDIKSEAFRAWFIDRIKLHPHPQKVVIEFVETEDYSQDVELLEFLKSVKDIGCKIAVDDFGVGFATYTSIIALKPDYIKIDGDIIKNITTNIDNKIILSSISYMAKLIGAQTTAEFVEDKEIQDIVVSYDVDYSQGYYFAKPMPYEDLTIE